MPLLCLGRDLVWIEKAINLAVGGRREHDGGAMERAACNCMMNNGSVRSATKLVLGCIFRVEFRFIRLNR